MLLLVFWDRFIWGLWIQKFVGFKNFFNLIRHKSIQLFTFIQALLGALKPYAACAAAAVSWPSRLHGFDLCQNELAWFHVMSRVVQRAHMWFFLIFFCALFRGVRGLVWPFALRRLGGLVAFIRLLGFFLFWWFHSPCIWKIFSAVSRCSQKSTVSVRPWVAESNP